MSELSEETKRKDFQKLISYRHSLFDDPVLRQLAIELTLSCNCRCLHCGSECMSEQETPGAAKAGAPVITDEEILRTLTELKRDLKAAGKKAPFVFVTGGEPLLRPGVPALMDRVYRLGYNWGMTTNGILIDERAAEELKAAHMSSAGISIDGLEESHDWFRQHPGAYKKSLAAVRHLVSAGIKKVMVTTVVHRRNIDELEELYDIVRDTGCGIWRVINMEPIGRALDNPELMLTPGDYRRLLDFIQSRNTPEFPVNFGCNHFLGYDREFEVRPWYFLCQSGIRVMSIQADGGITGCLDIKRDPRMIQGNIRSDRLYDVWMNRFEIYRRDKATESTACRDCEYLKECDGGGLHTFDIEGGEPLICMLKNIK